MTLALTHEIPDIAVGGREIAGEILAICFGTRHWPAHVHTDEQLHLATLNFDDDLDQFTAWANKLDAHRDRPIIGTRIVHGAHAHLLGWDVALQASSRLTPADIDVLIKRVSL